MTESPSQVRMALVTLAGGGLPSEEALFASLAQLWPGLDPPADVQQRSNVLTFTLGGLTASVAWVPQPVPWERLEGPAAVAWYWPDAEANLRDHQSHLLVAVVRDARDAIDQSILLAQLTAAATQAARACGVVWGASGLVHEPGAFVEQCRTMTRADLPLYLWIDFRVDPQPDGSLVLYTTGMEALGSDELEVCPSRQDARHLIESVYNVAHYLLDRRPVIKDGETIGVSDDEQIKCRRGPSMWEPDREVIRLEF